MRALSFTLRYGLKTFAAVILIIILTIVDTYLTLDLVSRGAEELNPIMAYYLNQSPHLFFVVKYSLTCASIVMILSINDSFRLGTRKIRGESLLVPFIIALAAVVQWQLYLLHHVID
jgi:Domain of unknown function (DUF5658)